MENSLKQRIVGALVLIALAVIFLPAILKDKRKQEPLTSQIPAKSIDLMNTEISDEVIKKNKQTQDALDELEVVQRKTKIKEVKNVPEQSGKSEKVVTDIKPDIKVEPKSDELKSKAELKPADSKSEQKTLGENFKEAAWIIQIASFSNKENALKFVKKLRQKDHPAYSRETKQKGLLIYRIFVGPYVSEERAKKVLKSVNPLSPSPPAILQVYDPTKH